MHHEFYHLAKKIIENKSTGSLAMATVIHVRGSAYRREGTRMIVDSNGNWFGNISGGCLEGDILKKTSDVIKTGESLLVTYDTRESINKEIRVALGCNGVIDILIEPVNESVLDLIESIIKVFEEEKTAYVKTDIQIIQEHVSVQHEMSQLKPDFLASSVFENENFCHVEKTEFSISLYEFIGVRRKLVVWGSGPDVKPISQFATQLGWKTIVASDCGLEKFQDDLPGVDLIHSNFNDFISKTNLHKNTAVLLVSHDFYKDYFILEKIIAKNVKYIGIMGPKRRGARMLEEHKRRHPEIQFEEGKIHYPVGLDIGSDNPVEIALSIVAEVQSAFSGKDAAPLKQKSSRIHETGNTETEEFNPGDSVCKINYIQ